MTHKPRTDDLQFGVSLSEIWRTAAEAAAELGIDTRQVQKLAQQGKLTKGNLPREPGSRGKPPVGYSQLSIEEEKFRRMGGPRRTTEPTLTSDHASAALAKFAGTRSQTLMERYGLQPEHAARAVQLLELLAPGAGPAKEKIEDDAYVTVKEAAEIKRMSQVWIMTLCSTGQLPFQSSRPGQTGRGSIRILRADLRALKFEGRRG